MRNALVLLFLVACAASTRQKTINAALAATDASAAAFVTWDAQHQIEIAKTAPDRPAAEEKLAAWRKTVDVVEHATIELYRAIAIAAVANDDRSVTAMLKLAADLAATLKTAGVP